MVVGVKLGHARRNLRRVKADYGSARALLADEAIELGGRQAKARSAGDVGVRGDLAAVHPEQKFWLVQPDHRAVGVGTGERSMHLPDPPARPIDLGGGAVGADPDKLDGSREPAPGLTVPREGGVLPGCAHRPWMQ